MKDKIVLIVDDMEINRELLGEILEDEYEVLTAADGDEAIGIIDKKRSGIDVILLDLVMPCKDGFEVLDYMGQTELLGNIPVLIISGDQSVESEKKCFEMGVSDFIHKPFDATLVRRRVNNVAELYLYKHHLEEKVESQTLTLKSQYKQLQEQAAVLKKNNRNIIDILGTVVESRDLESGEHIQRVKGYTQILANQMMADYPEYELTPHKIDVIVSASALHDVGKIAIPDQILTKPGRLTEEEFECMKTHTTKGCEILKNIEEAWDTEYGQYSYEICRYHHERFNGRGYPDHLEGDDIPISAQLVSVADVYDALVNERCYKDAFSPDKAYEMILNNECGVFSPKLLEVFKKSKQAFEELTKPSKTA